jgi:hypothetical protein
MLAIGVSYDDFWHGDPAIVRFAIEAYQEKQRDRMMHDDFVAWNAGRYVMMAVGVVLSQAFSKNSSAKYPSEPLIATELDEKLAEQKRERQLKQQHDSFLALAQAMQIAQGNQRGVEA